MRQEEDLGDSGRKENSKVEREVFSLEMRVSQQKKKKKNKKWGGQGRAEAAKPGMGCKDGVRDLGIELTSAEQVSFTGGPSPHYCSGPAAGLI